MVQILQVEMKDLTVNLVRQGLCASAGKSFHFVIKPECFCANLCYVVFYYCIYFLSHFCQAKIDTANIRSSYSVTS